MMHTSCLLYIDDTSLVPASEWLCDNTKYVMVMMFDDIFVLQTWNNLIWM